MKSRMSLFVLLLGLVINNCSSNSGETGFISADNPNIVYEGRIASTEDGAKELYWSGTEVSIKFQGTGVSAVLSEERGDNYYNILVS